MTSIYQTTELCSIYPDISAQLCNKHVKKLSNLKALFKDIYDQMQPQGYVLVNGVAKVIDMGHDLHVSFALENGVSVLYSKTYKNEDIYINGNHIQQQIIFNTKGKHEDGIHQKIDEIKKLLKLVRKASIQKEFYGGIIYVHSNIGENLFGFQQCFIAGLALALIQVHQELSNYTHQSLVELICQVDPKLSKKIITNLIQKYSLNHLIVQSSVQLPKKAQSELQINIINPNTDKSILTPSSAKYIKNSSNSVKTAQDECPADPNTDSDTNSSFGSIQKIQTFPPHELKSLQVNLKDSHKLVFCKLDVSKEQQDDYSSKMETIRKISEYIQQQGISRNQLINQNVQITLHQQLKEIVGQNEQLIEYYEQIRNLLSLLTAQTIRFEQFLKMKYELDREYQIYDEEVDQILSKLQSNNRYLQNFCIIQGEILLISMDKQYYAEVMVFLRKLINESQLSTYKYLTTHLKTDFDQKYNDISEIMFTAMPSAGFAIYRPNQQENFWI